eukprot:COSAG05_NODE_10571_length_558_cov_0.886710_2_plen_80_part_00
MPAHAALANLAIMLAPISPPVPVPSAPVITEPVSKLTGNTNAKVSKGYTKRRRNAVLSLYLHHNLAAVFDGRAGDAAHW